MSMAYQWTRVAHSGITNTGDNTTPATLTTVGDILLLGDSADVVYRALFATVHILHDPTYIPPMAQNRHLYQ